MVGVGARSPFEYQAGGLVDQEIQDGQVDVKLVFLVFHAPGEVEEAVLGAIAMLGSGERVSQLLLQVSHGWVLEACGGQHGERGV